MISFHPLDLAVEKDEAHVEKVEEVANEAEKVVEGEEQLSTKALTARLAAKELETLQVISNN